MHDHSDIVVRMVARKSRRERKRRVVVVVMGLKINGLLFVDP